ncbi:MULTISPECIES: sulfur carrier protein ThiS adenylyltransferase ThiF [unclassified Clostridium]|uniref:sulfur carrier protein ThiS adenylyltransferase ThiF n=1 Tax=unclassified Clostridium TaxID=2614128 RepID=UPI0002980187|nr:MULTISPECIES: sulfur carrier protein ThiS adenylyltransferase ThiF [unclassified Clostridium]EKQ55397.1 MAG: thiamine biosynthesis protein ThiF, family 2 [Clostridium sp. Maddingley MBC34-26]
MRILVNEKEVFLDNEVTAFKVREKLKSDADIVILNGFPIKADYTLNEGDKVTLIKRGEIPKKEELEALMVSRHTPKVHEKVKKARVAIAGLGGLGSTVALALGRIGVGYLKIIDFDVVEPSNLNRQQYFIRHIGMKKCDALKDILSDINPFIEVNNIDTRVTEDNIKELFEDMDIVIEAFDGADNKAMIVREVLLQTEKPKIVSASGMAGYYSNNLIVSKKINSRLYMCGDFENEAKINEGLMAPRVGIAACHEANMALRLILDECDV